MKLYGGIDLHSNNNYIGIKNEDGKIVFGKKIKNNPELILKVLKPFQDNMEMMCVESTYNWYWLVDLLQDNGYPVKLANPLAIQQYKGLKNANDKIDAFWLAEMLRLDILPTGHIISREMRSMRDLLRRRMSFVQQRTANKISLMSLFERELGLRFSSSKIVSGTIDFDMNQLQGCFKKNVDVLMKSIDALNVIINEIEDEIMPEMSDKDEFHNLNTIPGVGKILAMTILLESGEISRFKKVGNYTSYCRCTDAKRRSNGKVKGQNLSKCGNKYLSWAFSEAAMRCAIYCKEARRFYDRKMTAKKQPILANRALASKLTKAVFHILTDETEFSIERCFGC